MSIHRSRVGALVEIITANNHTRLQAVRSAWADAGEVSQTRVIVQGVKTTDLFTPAAPKGSRGYEIPNIARKKNKKSKVIKDTGFELFFNSLQKLFHFKKAIEHKDGTITVVCYSETVANEMIATLNGKSFIFGDLKVSPVQPRKNIADIDFKNQPKCKVLTAHDDKYTVRYIITLAEDIIFAFRQHSERNKIEPWKNSIQGDKDFWTLTTLFADGTVGPTDQAAFSIETLYKHLETLAGKKYNLSRSNVEIVEFEYEDDLPEKSNKAIPASLFNESQFVADYRFYRASNRQEDRSSTAGWGEKPGQWSEKAGGTINNQVLAEQFAREHGLLEPDQLLPHEIHGKKVYGIKIGNKPQKVPETFSARVTLRSFDKDIARIKKHNRLDKLAKEAQVIEPLSVRKQLDSSKAKPRSIVETSETSKVNIISDKQVNFIVEEWYNNPAKIYEDKKAREKQKSEDEFDYMSMLCPVNSK